MPITLADLERMSQEYPIDNAVRLIVRDVPSLSVSNPDITYISMQLNGDNPIDDIILQGLIPFKKNGKSVSGLVRLLLYHYFTYPLGQGHMGDEHGSDHISES